MTRPKRPLTMADLTTRERHHLELCIHEAGHAVVGVMLGAQLRNAVVTNSRLWGIDGLTTFADRPHGRDPEIAYAGPWSQARWRAGSPNQRQMLAVLGGSGYKDERALIAAGGTYLGHGIKPLLERVWPGVIRVAQQLHRTGEVGQDDVLAALGITDGGGLTSSQLASLRSNCRSVPPLERKPTNAAVPALT